MAKRAQAKVTTDHSEIRQWAEERGARPSCVRGTGGEGDIGMLRLDFPGYIGEQSLAEISWDDWFQKFDERGLALLHQDTTARGEQSNFSKLIARETAQVRAQGARNAKRATARGKRAATARTRSSRSRERTTRATGAQVRSTATASTRGAASRGKASSRRKTTARSASNTRTQRASAQKQTSRTATSRARTRRKAA